MMGDLAFYFTMGWKHIMSLDALDHLLIIIVLSAVYLLREWRQLLILITAFTIGHAITLTLSVLNILKLNSSLAEFLIAVSIVISCGINLFLRMKNKKHFSYLYVIALLFGLFHGLGFAGYLRFMLPENDSLLVPLASFNVELEAGQVIIVCMSLIFQKLLMRFFDISHMQWIKLISLTALIPALYFSIQRFPFLS